MKGVRTTLWCSCCETSAVPYRLYQERLQPWPVKDRFRKLKVKQPFIKVIEI